MRRRPEASFGKIPTTSILLRISLLTRSIRLVVRINRRCSKGKSNTVNPSDKFSSSQADKRGAEAAYFWIAACKNGSVLFRSGVLKMEQISTATSLAWLDGGHERQDFIASETGIASQNRSSCRSQAIMIIADRQLDILHTTVFQGLEKGFPVGLLLAQRHRYV